MERKNLWKSLMLFMLIMFAGSQAVFADAIDDAGNELKGKATTITNWIVTFAGIGLFVGLIWVGILFAFARDDEEKQKKARGALKAWIIGFVVFVIATSMKGYFFGF